MAAEYRKFYFDWNDGKYKLNQENYPFTKKVKTLGEKCGEYKIYLHVLFVANSCSGQVTKAGPLGRK